MVENRLETLCRCYRTRAYRRVMGWALSVFIAPLFGCGGTTVIYQQPPVVVNQLQAPPPPVALAPLAAPDVNLSQVPGFGAGAPLVVANSAEVTANTRRDAVVTPLAQPQ